MTDELDENQVDEILRRKKFKPILPELFDRKVCFAICIGLITMKLKSIDRTGFYYFVTIHQSDRKHLPEWKWRKAKDPKEALTYELTYRDIDIFKEKIGRFTMVDKGLHGAVFELKDKPFKEYFRTLTPAPIPISPEEKKVRKGLNSKRKKKAKAA